MLSPRSVLKIARSGDVRERLRAVRDGQAAIRLATVAAGLDTGVLPALRTPHTTVQLAAELDLTDHDLLEAFLRTLVTARLVSTAGGAHRLTRRGRAVLDDDVVAAVYEGFADFHTGVYRDLPGHLRGGPPRRDVTEHAGTIAAISRAMEPLLHDVLAAEVRAAAPLRVLDVGCGDGSHLVHVLRVADAAVGVGVEVDAGAAATATAALEAAGLTSRAEVVRADIRDVARDAASVGGPVDLALLANVVYYLPPEDRAELLAEVGRLLTPGGRLVVAATIAEDGAFSRHFDLLLRAQDGRMSLPTPAELEEDLRTAGLEPTGSRRLAPRDPLYVITARRP